MPADHYHPPARPWDGQLREPDYADGTAVRRVRSNGEIKWGGELVFLGEALVGEPVGLAATDQDGLWLVSYGPVALATIDADGKLHRVTGACPRNPQTQPPG